MRAGLLIALAALFAISASAAGGKVRGLRGANVFLNKGSVDGLKAGDKVRLRYKKRGVGACVIDDVGDHHASCTGKYRRTPNRFTFTTKTRSKDEESFGKRARPIDDKARRRWQRSVGADPIEPVPFSGTIVIEDAKRIWPISLTVRQRSTSYSGAYHQTRFGIDVSGIGLGVDGLRGYLAADMDVAIGQQRFLPDAFFRLNVRELAVGYAPSNLPVFGKIGRVRPRGVVGMSTIDGGLAGYRGAGWELGAYGGSLPTNDALVPRFDTYLLGGFWGYRAASDTVSFVHRGRVGMRIREANVAADGELSADISWNTLRAYVGGRVAMSDQFDIENVYAGASYQNQDWRLRAQYRHAGVETFPLDDDIYPYGATERGLAHIAYRGLSFIDLGITTDAHYDGLTEYATIGIAPELRFPSFLGGDLTLSYREALGNEPNRAVIARYGVSPFRGWFLRSQTVLSDTAFKAEIEGHHEVVQHLSIDGDILDWLSLRTTARTRFSLPNIDQQPNAEQYGLGLDVALNATF